MIECWVWGFTLKWYEFSRIYCMILKEIMHDLCIIMFNLVGLKQSNSHQPVQQLNTHFRFGFVLYTKYVTVCDFPPSWSSQQWHPNNFLLDFRLWYWHHLSPSLYVNCYRDLSSVGPIWPRGWSPLFWILWCVSKNKASFSAAVPPWEYLQRHRWPDSPHTWESFLHKPRWQKKQSKWARFLQNNSPMQLA